MNGIREKVMEAKRKAREVYEEAVASSLKTHNKAEQSAWKSYKEAMKEIEEVKDNV